MPDNGFSPQKSVRLRIALTLHVLDWSLPSNNFELQTCDQDLALYFYITSAQNWVFPRELNCFKLYNLELRWRGLRFIWHNFVSFLRLQFWHREHTQIWHSLISPPLCICQHRLAHMALQKIKSFTNVLAAFMFSLLHRLDSSWFTQEGPSAFPSQHKPGTSLSTSVLFTLSTFENIKLKLEYEEESMNVNI